MREKREGAGTIAESVYCYQHFVCAVEDGFSPNIPYGKRGYSVSIF